MFAGIDTQKEYWDKIWQDRIIDSGHVKMNFDKMKIVMKEISKRPYYKNLKILDVGCGTGIHALALRSIWGDGFTDNWHGIDLAESAIGFAQRNGLNAESTDFYEFKTDKKFDAFWFLDSFEHFNDDHRIAEKIWELSNPNFYIFGNIPLYSFTDHGKGSFERSVGKGELLRFLEYLGIKGFWHFIYGAFGMPYMVFEAKKDTHEKNLGIFAAPR